nr:MAG TPA: hypothetical protein [Caudoviricetes sp.]
MTLVWHPEDWHPALQCACQAVRWSLQMGISFPEIVNWFYSDETFPCSDDWDECVLRARWETHTWRGVFQMWDECGRPEYDPSCWGWDECDPESRRDAQGNARLDAVGEMVYDRFPEALEWAARELGWEMRWGTDFPDGVFPAGAVALDEGGLEAAAGDEWIAVLIPPAVVVAA